MPERSEMVTHDRRANHPLTDEQIDEIAERAAEKALEKVYTSIGKSVVSKLLWLLGAASVAVAAWMNGHGLLK